MSKIILYKDTPKYGISQIQEIQTDWSRKSNKNHSILHKTSYYLGNFPPALPYYFINKYSKEEDLVMDNFCGKGTTGLVARELNRSFIGNDLNPYAYVLTKFKISQINKIQILKRINELQELFNQWIQEELTQEYQELLIYYSKDTLQQLIFLRNQIGINWITNSNIDNAVLSIALGLMHGQVRKNGTSTYFSLSMPNTFSMSPHYTKKYAENKRLIRPDINVFENIKLRLESIYDPILEQSNEAEVFFKNSLEENQEIKDKSVDLVITSPPYLNLVNYTNSNWLKLWLLGYDRKNLKTEIKLSDKLKFNEYVQFIEKYLKSIYSKLKDKAKVCLVVGDIYNQELIEEVWLQIRERVNYEFVEIYYDYKYSQNSKTTLLLTKNKPTATKIEKVLVLEKI